MEYYIEANSLLIKNKYSLVKNEKYLSKLIKNFPRLKKVKISKNEDLVKNGIIDSLELMKLISYLKKNINLILIHIKKE